MAGSMAGLMTGGKLGPLALFARGVRDVEAAWREANPDFEGGLRERWRRAIEFYDETHQDPRNRALHVVGIPIIIGGVSGLLLWPRYTPPWVLSACTFGLGWTLNLAGHALFERNAPAFADDPLSFVAGPVWDITRFREWMSSVDEGDGAPAASEPSMAPAA